MIILFLFLFLINSIKIENPQTLIFNKSPLYINNIKYRESINPIYFIYFNKGIFNISQFPLQSIHSKPIDGNTKLCDIYLNNSWKIIDNLYYFHSYNGPIQILASLTFNKNISIRLRNNNKIIYYYYGNSLYYFNKIWEKEGDVNLFLEAKSNKNLFFNPSYKNGYYYSYQLGLWSDYNKNKNSTDKYGYEIKINDVLFTYVHQTPENSFFKN